jgi:hypothetical protein
MDNPGAFLLMIADVNWGLRSLKRSSGQVNRGLASALAESYLNCSALGHLNLKKILVATMVAMTYSSLYLLAVNCGCFWRKTCQQKHSIAEKFGGLCPPVG